jgi:hypothetical protein
MNFCSLLIEIFCCSKKLKISTIEAQTTTVVLTANNINNNNENFNNNNNNNANSTNNTNNSNNNNNNNNLTGIHGYKNRTKRRKSIKNPIRNQEIIIREPILIHIKELEEKEIYNYAFIHNETDNTVFFDNILAPG